MELWHGELPDFISRARGTDLASDLTQSFIRAYRRAPPEAEVRSWDESLRAMAAIADEAITDDIGILVEYHLPLSERRIDIMFFGHRLADARPNSLLVELKRWDRVTIEDEFALNVLIGEAEHVHPSQQALDYAGFLQDIHSEYVTGSLTIQPCSYCHVLDAQSGAVLRDPRFGALLGQSPTMLAGEESLFANFLNEQVGGGHGVHLMRNAREGSFQPGQKIIERVDAIIKRDAEWHLLDEQRKAYNTIRAELKRLGGQAKRSAVLVRGGPGTGKSVIAIQLLADALRDGLKAAHSTGGKAFTTVMRAKFSGADSIFAWNRSLRRARSMELDLLLVDEAHRIRKTSDDRFTKAAERNRRSQVDELLDASRVAVFLLDEHQYMRPDEIGSSRLVRDATSARNIPLREYDLNAQFRCGGCREYLEWVDQLLGFGPAPTADWTECYKVSILGEPEELDLILEAAEATGDTARIIAGFCWKWSDPLPGEVLVDDVVVDDWRRPWNRKEGKNKTYRPENHPYTLWATAPEGLGQVGVVYSSQGFEFDHVGVIWGHDLVWREGRWLGQKKMSKDPGLRIASPEEFTRLVRHAYRVLLSRGIKSTSILCLDDETRAHIIKLLGHARTLPGLMPSVRMNSLDRLHLPVIR